MDLNGCAGTQILPRGHSHCPCFVRVIIVVIYCNKTAIDIHRVAKITENDDNKDFIQFPTSNTTVIRKRWHLNTYLICPVPACLACRRRPRWRAPHWHPPVGYDRCWCDNWEGWKGDDAEGLPCMFQWIWVNNLIFSVYPACSWLGYWTRDALPRHVINVGCYIFWWGDV